MDLVSCLKPLAPQSPRAIQEWWGAREIVSQRHTLSVIAPPRTSSPEQRSVQPSLRQPPHDRWGACVTGSIDEAELSIRHILVGADTAAAHVVKREHRARRARRKPIAPMSYGSEPERTSSKTAYDTSPASETLIRSTGMNAASRQWFGCHSCCKRTASVHVPAPNTRSDLATVVSAPLAFRIDRLGARISNTNVWVAVLSLGATCPGNHGPQPPPCDGRTRISPEWPTATRPQRLPPILGPSTAPARGC